MPLAVIRRINDHGDRYHGLMIWCPGCEYEDEDDGKKYGGLHMLPVSGDKSKRPTWLWDGSTLHPTVTPSILTKFTRADTDFVCHSFLRDGQWQFLGDSTHWLSGKTVPMVPLPEWVF